MIWFGVFWALASTTTPLSLEQAVDKAVAVANDVDAPTALNIEATRLDEGAPQFDAFGLSLEHRAVDQFFIPRLDNNGLKVGPLDNVAIGAELALPQLSKLVTRSAADLRAEASRAALKDRSRTAAKKTRALVVDIAALRRERALLDSALRLAREQEILLVARLGQGVATALLVDDAVRNRISLSADALEIDDDLQRARADLSLLTNDNDDVDDDIEARCLQTLPSSPDAVANAHDQSQKSLRLLSDALEREALGQTLSYLPWPTRLQGTFINRDATSVDDVRLGIEVDVPLFRIFDSHDEALALRRRANASERALLAQRLNRQMQAAQNAVVERKKMALLLTLPPPTFTPEDAADITELALRRNLAERRRLRAIARCAHAVVDLLSLTH